jgi:hypothetical protein
MPSSWLMAESLTVVMEHFPEGRIEGVDVADVAASAVKKASDWGQMIWQLLNQFLLL